MVWSTRNLTSPSVSKEATYCNPWEAQAVAWAFLFVTALVPVVLVLKTGTPDQLHFFALGTSVFLKVFPAEGGEWFVYAFAPGQREGAPGERCSAF